MKIDQAYLYQYRQKFINIFQDHNVDANHTRVFGFAISNNFGNADLNLIVKFIDHHSLGYDLDRLKKLNNAIQCILPVGISVKVYTDEVLRSFVLKYNRILSSSLKWDDVLKQGKLEIIQKNQKAMHLKRSTMLMDEIKKRSAENSVKKPFLDKTKKTLKTIRSSDALKEKIYDINRRKRSFSETNIASYFEGRSSKRFKTPLQTQKTTEVKSERKISFENIVRIDNKEEKSWLQIILHQIKCRLSKRKKKSCSLLIIRQM